jgi:hypothetical protein
MQPNDEHANAAAADAAFDPANAPTVDLHAAAPPSRPLYTHVERTWRIPAWLWAPAALYTVSAACILYGVAQIIVPVVSQPNAAVEKFYSLAALNLYEIALLFVALLIVLWRRVYDDAVALTVLIALFMIASATALDTVAPDFHEPVLLFGIAGVLMASAKMYSLDRLIVGELGWPIAAGLAVLLLGNFLMPAVLGFNQANDVIQDDLRDVWLGGWLTALLGAGVLLVAAAMIPTGDLGADDEGQPFLRTAVMRWVIVGLVLAGTIAHQYALTWAFGLRVEVGDLLAGVAVAALILLELVRGYGCRFNVLDEGVALVPLAVAAVVLAGGFYTTDLNEHLGLAAYPPVVLAAVAVWLAGVGFRTGQRSMHAVSAAYALAAVVTFDASPKHGWAPTAVRTYDFFSHRHGWLFVAISFIILAAGAWVSVTKDRARRPRHAEADGLDDLAPAGMASPNG